MKVYIKYIIGYFISFFIRKRLLKNGETVILMYHRVVAKVDNSHYDKSLYVSQKTFEKNIKYLLNNGFEIIGFSEWLQLKRKDSKYCIITFDDGWRDNYKNAYPVLLKYNIPATIFLTADFIKNEECLWFEKLNKIFIEVENKPQVFHELQLFFKDRDILDEEDLKLDIRNFYLILVEKLKKFDIDHINRLIAKLEEALSLRIEDKRMNLNWDEIHEMSNNKISFGSHGYHHQIIPALTSSQKKYEIFESKSYFENENINLVPIFSFPNGIIDTESLKIVKEAGYKATLVASKENTIGFKADSDLISRICMSEAICGSDALMAFRLLLGKIRKEFM